MVATRNHPVDFDSPAETPTPEPSPRKRSTRTSTATTTTNNTNARPTPSSPSLPSPIRTRSPHIKTSRTTSGQWSHTPSNLTLLWLSISLPLVAWDTGYVVLRPHSMPGGWAHWPLWTPYALYGEIDHVYGFKAFNAHSGWTLAQGSVNVLETLAYVAYLYLVYVYGEHEEGVQGTGAPDRETFVGRLKGLSESRTVYGQVAGWAVVVAYTTAQITFWKTVLYWLIEWYSGKSSPLFLVPHTCLSDNLPTDGYCLIHRLRQHRPQRLGDTLLHVDHPQRRMARLAGLHDLRLRAGDPARSRARRKRWRDEAVVAQLF